MSSRSHSHKKPRAPKRRRASQKTIFFNIFLTIIAIFVFSITIYKVTDSIINASGTHLPKLEISLTDVTIEAIDAGSKETKYSGNTAKLTYGNQILDFRDVEIKGRGNSTWAQAKKPYQIKFNEKVDLFEYGKAKKWVLLSNALDPTYLRNDFALKIEHILNTDYALNGQFIELYIDDQYRGLYYLSEKVEIDKSRVGLSDELGILAEIENLHSANEECTSTAKISCLKTHDLVNSDNSNRALTDFTDSIKQFETTLAEKDFNSVANLIDVDSFAKYYLLSEFTVNPDAYSSSFFLYKNGASDKIHAGPGWDFDLSLGNVAWTSDGVDRETFFSPFTNNALRDYTTFSNQSSLIPFADGISTIVYDLLTFPEFESRVKEIYMQTLSGHKDELLDYIKSQADYIRPAALRDAKRWKLQTNFDDEVDYLIDWVAKRFDHFEATYNINTATKEPADQTASASKAEIFETLNF
ncbi:CotH kinase family protein [Candidatus Saccharibacteria bacterium]|nr:CotH kinase family protein [Candidatus Saccharibacteria bacterium]